MELIIKNNLDVLKNVEFNFDELKEKLELKLEKYKSLVYTDDKIKEAKEDRADLNKLSKEIDTKRKDIKKEIMKPYDSFELKVTELLDIIKKPINEIDDQVKKYEEKLRKEKKTDIEIFYTEQGITSLLPLERIFQENWLNQTVTLKKVKEEIEEKVGKFKSDLTIIEEMGGDFVEPLKKHYIAGLDFSSTMLEKNKLDEAKKIVLQTQEQKKEVIEEPKKEEVKFEMKKTLDEKPEQMSVTLKITTDKDRFNLLKNFIVENKINYERMDK